MEESERGGVMKQRVIACAVVLGVSLFLLFLVTGPLFNYLL